MVSLPKHDIAAEQALLGAMLIDSSIVPEVVSEISSVYFFEQSHGLIFKSMAFLSSQSIPIDLITVKAQLEKFNKLDSVGGISYLAELTETVAYSANWKGYQDIIKEKYYLREISTLSYGLQDKIHKGENPLDILEFFQSESGKIISTASATETHQITDLLMRRYEELAELYENKDMPTKIINIGYKSIHNLLGGLHPGNLMIIAARPAMGKTTFALNVQDYVIRQQKRVAFFSLEMSEQEIADKIIGLYSDINAFLLRVGKISEGDLRKVEEVHDKLMDKKLYIDASPTLTPALLRSKLLKLSMSGLLDLVIVDYLQLMKCPGETNRVQEVSEISRQLKLLAKEFNVPIIALSQLSRSLEARSDKRPVMSDLRESGSIEQDADQIMFLYRDEYYNEFSDKPNIVEVILKKNRHGSSGTVELFFDKKKQRMLAKTEQGMLIDGDGFTGFPESSKQMSI